MLLTHFLRGHGQLRLRLFRPGRALVKKICKRGVPEAMSQLTTPVTALCYNLVLSHMVGDLGVSTFSVLSFLYSLANAILSGVAQGLQPLWGNGYGKQDTAGLRFCLRRGLAIDLALAVGIWGLLFAFDRPVIQIFNRDPALVEAASAALPVFALSFIPMALNLIYTAFLFSTKRTASPSAGAWQ